MNNIVKTTQSQRNYVQDIQSSFKKYNNHNMLAKGRYYWNHLELNDARKNDSNENINTILNEFRILKNNYNIDNENNSNYISYNLNKQYNLLSIDNWKNDDYVIKNDDYRNVTSESELSKHNQFSILMVDSLKELKYKPIKSEHVDMDGLSNREKILEKQNIRNHNK